MQKDSEAVVVLADGADGAEAWVAELSAVAPVDAGKPD